MKVNIGKYPKKANAERKISVKIDPWDTWSTDHTLAYIIHPLLIQLQKTKHGSPLVDDEDVPEELRSTSAPPRENDWDTDANHFKRWDWVLDEMIWAFAQILDDEADMQFHTGEHDMMWRKVNIDGDVLDETLYKMGETPTVENDEKVFWEMVKGPNDTHVFDREGWEKWRDRKQNGFKLFGKYFEALWD